MFQVIWEARPAQGARIATNEILPRDYSQSNAVQRFGQVLCTNWATLYSARLLQVELRDDKYVVTHTLAQFNADGL